MSLWNSWCHPLHPHQCLHHHSNYITVQRKVNTRMFQKCCFYLPFIDEGFFFLLGCDLHWLGLNTEARSGMCVHELDWGPFGCRIDVNCVFKQRTALMLRGVLGRRGRWRIVCWDSWGPSLNLRFNQSHVPRSPVFPFAQNDVAWITIDLGVFIVIGGGLFFLLKLCLLLNLDFLVRNHGIDRLFFQVLKWVNNGLLVHLKLLIMVSRNLGNCYIVISPSICVFFIVLVDMRVFKIRGECLLFSLFN